jgi:hypothetical protein
MPNPIDDDDRLAMAVGRAVSHWAHAELHLASVFARLTGMDLTMATTVFRMFRSVPNQKEALSSVARVSTQCDEAALAVLTSILAEYGVLATRRNEIAHNALGWHDGDRQQMYRVNRDKLTKPGMFPYSPALFETADIEMLTAEIKVLVKRIIDFDRELIGGELARLSQLLSPPPVDG